MASCGRTVGDRSCNVYVDLRNLLLATRFAWVIGRMPGMILDSGVTCESFGTKGAAGPESEDRCMPEKAQQWRFNGGDDSFTWSADSQLDGVVGVGLPSQFHAQQGSMN
jgi:hypothetical protein